MRIHALSITDTLSADLVAAAHRTGITVDSARAEVKRRWNAMNKDLSENDALASGFALSGVMTVEVFDRAFRLYEQDPGIVSGRRPTKMWATAAKIVLGFPDALTDRTARLARRAKTPVSDVRQAIFRVALDLVRNDAPPLTPEFVHPPEVRDLLLLLGPQNPSEMAFRTAEAILKAHEGLHPGLAREVLNILLISWARVQTTADSA